MPRPLPPGLYDRVVDPSLADALAQLPDSLRAELVKIDPADLPARIAEIIARWITNNLEQTSTTKRDVHAVELLLRIGTLLQGEALQPAASLHPPIQALRSIAAVDPTGKPQALPRPASPIIDTFLLTNSRSEPNIGHELFSEIASADRIDLIMAFIRWSGIRKLMDPLREHVERGRPLRIITTSYTGTTELIALERLEEIGAEIRVSYDTSMTRLHAKAWLFSRDSGFSTAYVGSSNLTHSAQITGVEWNVRASETSSRPIIDKFQTVFETYWADRSFEPFDAVRFAESIKRESADTDTGEFHHLISIRPHPFQAVMLEQLALAREERPGKPGHHHNLVVAATGTGKTVVAALDYKRLRAELPQSKLLFVAHRKEILKQSRAMFRHTLSDGSFGELWVDGNKPDKWEHVFASIQSIAVNDIRRLAPDHFDVVIVDEFHHAAADSYDELLQYLKPRELLGMTATPERADGKSILHHFDDRFAVELRLWDALEQGLLVPFHYFGIHDETELASLPWKRGYSPSDLEKIYTADDVWVGKVWRAMVTHVGDVRRMRALGFCASVGHAHFMAKKFQEHGLQAQALDGASPSNIRHKALNDLRDGKLQILFAVDLFNEGLDIPGIDTVLMLRPTESATIFLQQLGRGLRRTDDKAVLTVLDFVGNQHANFRFEDRFRKLLGRSRTQLIDDIESGFPYLPAGTQIQLDRESMKIVLDNIRNALPSTWRKRVEELQLLAKQDPDVSLFSYLEHTGLELTDVYAGKHSWSELRVTAGLASLEARERRIGGETVDADRAVKKLGNGIGRLLHVDDPVRIDAWAKLLSGAKPPSVEGDTALPVRDIRLLHMLTLQLLNPKKGNYSDLDEAMRVLWENPLIRGEILELLPLLEARRTHRVKASGLSEEIPLQTHATYARHEVLAAIGRSEVSSPGSHREGVLFDRDNNLDVFFVTLQKTEKDFSPLTRYRDYAISDYLFHWESQHATSVESPTGQRYINHVAEGSKVLLFVREAKKTPDGRTAAFFNCGLADYVSHRGSRPIQITWRLHEPLPGDLFASYRAAVA